MQAESAQVKLTWIRCSSARAPELEPHRFDSMNLDDLPICVLAVVIMNVIECC